jgi:hypothetical protein
MTNFFDEKLPFSTTEKTFFEKTLEIANQPSIINEGYQDKDGNVWYNKEAYLKYKIRERIRKLAFDVDQRLNKRQKCGEYLIDALSLINKESEAENLIILFLDHIKRLNQNWNKRLLFIEKSVQKLKNQKVGYDKSQENIQQIITEIDYRIEDDVINFGWLDPLGLSSSNNCRVYLANNQLFYAQSGTHHLIHHIHHHLSEKVIKQHDLYPIARLQWMRSLMKFDSHKYFFNKTFDEETPQVKTFQDESLLEFLAGEANLDEIWNHSDFKGFVIKTLPYHPGSAFLLAPVGKELIEIGIISNERDESGNLKCQLPVSEFQQKHTYQENQKFITEQTNFPTKEMSKTEVFQRIETDLDFRGKMLHLYRETINNRGLNRKRGKKSNSLNYEELFLYNKYAGEPIVDKINEEYQIPFDVFAIELEKVEVPTEIKKRRTRKKLLSFLKKNKKIPGENFAKYEYRFY